MTINELREKRNQAWNAAKAFVETKRDKDGLLSEEDAKTYAQMEKKVQDYGAEIERMEAMSAMEAQLNRPTSSPITEKPMNGKSTANEKPKTGRASDAYRTGMLTALRSNFHQVSDVLREGVDADGGYLVPEEYDSRLIQTLSEENIMRKLGHTITTSGEHKINIAATAPAAAWIEEGGALSFGDATFAQILLDAHILSQLLAGDTRFTGWTNYSDAKAFSVTQPKSVRACLGGTEGSMLSKWYGEFEWDNFTVKFHSHRGQKTGVVIEYGKNLTAMEQDEDNSGVYTALLPYAVYTPEGTDTETVVTLPEVTLPIVTSEIVRAKTLIMDFSDQFDGVVTEEALRAKANSYIKANPLGATIPTVKVSFEPLWKQPEYSALLERVNLCDTVTIRHSLLGVSVSAMVIETVYDTLAERYKSISLGQSKSSMITTISEVQSSVDKVESTVGRFPKLLQTAIGKATGLITGQSGGYVVINTDSESGQPYELLILDAPSIDEAVNVWRWNVGGLGFSHNGYNGPYETAITADGQIVADFITSGSLVANIIKAGVIQSQDGSSWWDLESGEVVLRAYATSKEVTEVSDRITTIEEQKMLRLVIISSNGNIFKNGNVKTLLSAKVYSWDEDITDTLDANQFVWTRVSEDTEADKVWNEQHFGGAKSVVITGADVKIRATFYCDLIDTTTRQSLL